MSATTVSHPGTDLVSQLDDSGITPTHWKIMFISGMGFFTDAYDLFVIGVVMSLLKGQWQVSATADGLVTSTALLASVIGAVLFGRIADMLGRKRIYGFEVLVLAAGAIASALSPNIWWLIVFRFIPGGDPHHWPRRRLRCRQDRRFCRRVLVPDLHEPRWATAGRRRGRAGQPARIGSDDIHAAGDQGSEPRGTQRRSGR